MTGQLVAAILLGLAVLPVGWMIRREAQRTQRRRELQRRLAEASRATGRTQLIMGGAMVMSLGMAARAFADFEQSWQAVEDAAR